MLGESLVNLDDENLDVDALTAALVNSDDNFGEGHENFLDPLDESLLVSPEAAATPTHAATSKSESGSVAGAAGIRARGCSLFSCCARFTVYRSCGSSVFADSA